MSTQPFSIPDPLEVAYRGVLSKLIKSWLPIKLVGGSDSHWLRELSSVSTRQDILNQSIKVASNLITRVNVINIKDWREASVKSTRSDILHHLISQELSGRIGIRVKDLINENASRIADLPRAVSNELAQEIAKAQQAGIRSDTIAKALRIRFPEVMNSKIHLLARTQSSSAGTALTRARCEELDISCFIWENSHDRRVRPSHRNMQSVVCFWKDLPSPELLIGQPDYLGHYAPGNCPNCRCTPLPVLTVEDVYSTKKTSARIYHDGAISLMTRQQFISLSGIESRLAA